MIMFLSMTLAGLAVHLVNDWTEPFLSISPRAMLDLIIFVAVFMFTNRYLKSLRN